jgi:hypothetical protein
MSVRILYEVWKCVGGEKIKKKELLMGHKLHPEDMSPLSPYRDSGDEHGGGLVGLCERLCCCTVVVVGVVFKVHLLCHTRVSEKELQSRGVQTYVVVYYSNNQRATWTCRDVFSLC